MGAFERPLEPQGATLPAIAGDVATGLLRQPKSLSPWLLYDEQGSRLFERITALPEYYLTRAESEILELHADDMLSGAGANLLLVELGAGTAAKTATLIRALLRRQMRVEFYPIDVCGAALEIARQSLQAISPRVKVCPVVADYTSGWEAVDQRASRHLVLYLGSSIGNFEPGDAIAVLRRVRSQLRSHDALLLGTDLAKWPPLLEAAYDDPAGVTAEFNLNLLTRINRELGGHFDPSSFRHRAQWNPRHSRMELYLESKQAQSVPIDLLDLEVTFAAGELVHTENSYKFLPEMVRSILQKGGFELERTWTDRRDWFALHLARAA